MKTALALALVALALASIATAPAEAIPPRPLDLRVVGDAPWHADNAFSLSWTEPPPEDPPLVATRYRVRDPLGAVLREGRLGWTGDGLGPLLVPKIPGAYGAEVWFEDATGGQGPAASTELRFDDTRPGAIAPGAVPQWIGRTALPLHIRLDHPSGPQPLSGIRGYAAAVDQRPEGSPCSTADRCSEAETTLRGGIDNDELTIADLPEGLSYLHVVAVSGAGMKSAASGQTILHVDKTDPVTRLEGAPLGWTDKTAQLSASADDAGSGMAPSGGGLPPFTAIQVDAAAPSVALGGRVTASVIAEGAHRISYYARDAAGNVDDGAAGNGLPNRPSRTTWVRIDRTAPQVAFLNSQDPHDPDLIRARIADPLSGPDLGQGRIGVRPARSGDPFELLPQAPPGDGELRARWDSDRHPPGEYEFEARGYDEAGNLTTTTLRANGTPMVLSNPLKATTTLHAAFLPRGLSRTVPYGRRVLLRGHLITGLGSGLEGRSLRIVERFAAAARPAIRVSSLETGPGGSFSIRTASGPSRTIELYFAGTPTLARSAGPGLRLDVRSRVRLRASAGSARVGGRPLVFRGRVGAAPGTIPSEGIPVQLQFRLGHLPWSAFRTVQTDRGGHFHYAYRFTDDDSRGARFQFRAYVPDQENWPYEPAGSRPVLVRGR
ncbi:MAG TPA: hypothetical protein VFI09_05395 [Solirubrobacterales bacterium]|nr:hypothetical protein [Solirubrobacterales bacterium]